MKTIKLIMLVSLLFSAVHCHADTITLKGGNVLTCDILTSHFGLITPYQNLFFIKDYISDINSVPNQPDHYTITTINNDFFTGRLINSQIAALMDSGLRKDFPLNAIKNIRLDPSYETGEADLAQTALKKTTLFKMKNGDSFSGQMTTGRLTLNTSESILIIDGKDLFRIVFTGSGANSVEIYLNNGSMHAGVLNENLIGIDPDSTPPISIHVSEFQLIDFHLIQFPSIKYIKRKITPDEYHNGEFCLFLCSSGFFAEWCTCQTTAVLLPDPDGHVGEIAVQTEGGQQILSAAGQAVIVRNAKEPPPLPIFFDDHQIQAVFGKALDAQPLVPQKFILYFNTDSADLLPDSKVLIPEIVKCIQERDAIDIHVNGFTDKQGSYKYNLALSLNRAAYVKALLVQSGIDGKGITILPLGETNPLIPTEDGVAEPRNRRVEVIVR
jgi:outer membrane protein OmpA-like peptidoglycan-associated protein